MLPLTGFSDELGGSDALNRIHWDARLNLADFTVEYVDRFSGEVVHVSCTDIDVNGDFFSTLDGDVPFHRIHEIKHKGRVVWGQKTDFIP